MSTTNPWLNPYQRSYEDIKNGILQRVQKTIPGMTDISEGNIFVLIISAFAAIAEVLHYYIDNMAREAFFPTARRYSSLMKHAKLVDYHIKSAVAPTVDVILYRTGDEPFGMEFEVPENTAFTSSDGKPWYSTRKVTSRPDEYSLKVPLIQREYAGDNIDLGTITSLNQEIYLPDPPTGRRYVEGSMVLYINGTPWTLVETFAYSNAIDTVYKVEVDSQLKPRIMFGDGTFGMKPPLNATVRASYYYTYGTAGNLPIGSFTAVPQSLSQKGINDLAISQPQAAAGGSNYENFNMLKQHVPLSIKTLGVAVTREDFEALAMLQPGVNKAYVEYTCGKQVDVYISPDGGTDAPEGLVDQVQTAMTRSKVLTSNVTVHSTHASQIYLVATIQGEKSYKSVDIQNQVLKALIEAYSQETSDINHVVRVSDIYALIDNCSMVDYSNINKLYLRSYALPTRAYTGTEEEGLIPLDITQFSLNKFTQTEINGNLTPSRAMVTVKIREDASTYKVSIDNEGYGEDCQFGERVSFSNDYLEFEMVISEENLRYNPNDGYTFYLSPMNQDLVPMEYNIPIFQTSNISLTINESV